MKHISIDVVDDRKAEKLIDLLTGLDFVDKLKVQEVDVPRRDEIDVRIEFTRHPRQDEMLREMMAFETLHSALTRQYLGEYVAIYHGAVVDHDVNEEQLIERIQVAYPDTIVFIEQVRRELQPPIKIRDRQLSFRER